MLLCPAIVFFVSAAVQGADAPSWPHWRGPARDGISHESDWSSVGRAEPLWSAQVGVGYSNVSIVDGRLYTLGHDAETSADRIVCLEAETGSELWQVEYESELMANFHAGGSLTTPTLDGEVVYVCGRLGRCFALDALTGEQRWQRDYGTELDLPPTQYGFAASPLVLGERLVLAFAGTILFVDKHTGEIEWRSEDYGEGGYATPVPFRAAQRDCLAVFSGPGLLILDAATGEELGRYPFRGQAGSVNACSPIVVDERIFISAAYGVGAALVDVSDPSAPSEVWSTKRMRNKVSGCVLWDGHVYGFDESMLKCIGWEDGAERWRVRGLGMGSVALAGGRLLVLGADGELIVAEATPEAFRELSRQTVLDGGVYWTSPVLLDGRIYCRSSAGELVCLDHRGGRALAAGAEGEGVTQSRAPAAEELFTQHAAFVGPDALGARKSVQLRGTFESPGAGITSSPATVDWITPNRWRLVYSLGEFGEIAQAYDGEVAWKLDPFYGNKILEGDALREIAETHSFHGAVQGSEPFARLGAPRRERFASRDCWAVEAETPSGAQRTYYFEVDGGRLAGREAENEAMVVYSDYADFEGVKLPTRISTLLPDTGEAELFVVTEVHWDAAEPSAFERPDEVLRMLRTPEELAAASAELRERWQAHLGSYVANEGPTAGVVYTLQVEEGELVVDIEGFRPVTVAESDEEGRLYIPPTDIYFTFQLGDGGVPVAMVLHNAPEAPEELVLTRKEHD